MSYENPSRRVLPVAQIYSFERIESVGLEMIVTLKVGDAENFPHAHGLRAPAFRWAEIFGAIAQDPHARDLMIAALSRPLPVCEDAKIDRGALPGPALVSAGERPAAEDPENAFFRRPITKPNGGVL